MENLNRYAPPKSEVVDVQALDEAPPLWNPNAAANWSLLFSPIFGAIVQMKNWQALGETKRAANSKMWAIGTAIAIVVVTILSAAAAVSTNTPDVGRSFGFVILIVWYFASGRAQTKFIKDRFGKDYPRRGWGKPLLIAIGIIFGVVAVAMIIGAIIGIASQM